MQHLWFIASNGLSALGGRGSLGSEVGDPAPSVEDNRGIRPAGGRSGLGAARGIALGLLISLAIWAALGTLFLILR